MKILLRFGFLGSNSEDNSLLNSYAQLSPQFFLSFFGARKQANKQTGLVLPLGGGVA
jgi:hypothetical protein